MSYNFYTDQFDYYAAYTITQNHIYDPENNPEDAQYADKDDSLLPGKVIVNPTNPAYAEERQPQRTCSSMARTQNGRIFMSYFSATDHSDEGAGNYNMLISSDDRGETFQDRVLIEPPKMETTRVWDCVPWVDDTNRLWVFYAQSYLSQDGRDGIWVVRCDNPDDDDMVFTEPRRIANGVVVMAPIITSKGEWLFAGCVWDPKCAHGGRKGNMGINNLQDEIGVSVYRSTDRGETFERIASKIRFPYSVFDEPCMAERKDGSLMMWIRGMNCTAHTFSYDGGHTWTIPVQNIRMNLPNTRFHFGKLKSGNLLLLCNYKADMFSYYGGRNNLCALLSKDDGETWEGCLMIDEREGSEQPDFVEGNDGFIYIGYGRAPQFAAESMLAIVTEEDILAGKLVNPQSKLRIVAGKSTGMGKDPVSAEWIQHIADDWGIELDTKGPITL